MLRKIIDEIENGNFETSFKLIHALQLNSSTSLTLLTYYCKAINECKDINIPAESLYDFLNEIVKCFDDLDERGWHRYFKCLFFVISYLIKVNELCIIIKLGHIVWPKCFKGCLNDEQKLAYLNICKLVYNAIVREENNNCKTVYEPILYKLCTFSIEIYWRVQNAHELIDKLFGYLHILNSQKRNMLEQHCLCQKYLEVAENYNDVDEDLLFKSAVKGLSVMILPVFQAKEFTRLEDFYKFTKKVIEKCSRKLEYSLQLEIIKTFVIFTCNFQGYTVSVDFLKCLNNFKNYFKTYGFTQSLYSTCTFVDNFLFSLEKVLKTDDNISLWQQIFTPDILRQIFEILMTVVTIFLHTSYQCSCYNCKTEVDITGAFNILLTFALLINALKYTIDLKAENLQSLNQCCSLVCQLKSSECITWTSKWSLVESHIYNIGVVLFNSQNNECIEYIEMLLKYFFQLENYTGPVLQNKKLVSSAFMIAIESYLRMKEFKKAILYSALHVYCVSHDQNFTYALWVKVKYECKKINGDGNSLEATTVVNVLCNEHAFINTVCPDVRIKNNEKETLLTDELNAYVKRFTSKVPMMAVCKELYDICDCIKMAETFVKIWESAKIPMHENVIILVHKTISKLKKQFKKNSPIEPHILLAKLCFIYYNYKNREVITKNSKEMKSIVSALEEQKDCQNVSDKDDRCDLFSSYSCLKLDHYLTISKFLNTALKTISNYIKDNNNLPQSVLAVLKNMNVVSLLINIAHEYTLHLQTFEALHTWLIALKVAKMVNNKLEILKCISFIIKLSDNKSSTVDDLLVEADEILSSLKDVSDNNLSVLATYCINVSFGYLYWEEIELSVRYYQRAFNYYSKIKSSETSKLLEVQINYLHFKLLMLPCNFCLEEHKKLCLGKIHQSLHSIRKICYAQAQKSTLAVILLLEITQTTLCTYKYMKLPREVRCYSKEGTSIAQMLIIPLRVSYFLAQLAYVDLLSTRYNDCKVKIDGISHVLCLEKTKLFNVDLNKAIDVDVDELGNDFLDMMLDLPKEKPHSCNTRGSPIFSNGPFQLPEFVYHNSKCDCFDCLSVEYQEIVLMKIHLDGEVNLCEQNVKLAQDCYFGGIRLVHKFKLKEPFRHEILKKKFNEDILPRGSNSLYESYSVLLLNHANNLIKSNNKTSALKINEELTSWITSKKLYNVYLFNEIFLQKLNLMSDSVNIFKIDKVCNQTEDDGTSNIFAVKTPKSRVMNSYSPNIVLPPKRVLKKIDFNISDDEKSPLKYVCSSVSKRNVKTPKIKIYTPSETKSTRKKKTVVSRLPLKSHTPDVSPVEGDIPFIIPVSPNAYTPSYTKPKSTRTLRSKAKTLPHKLKQEKSTVAAEVSNENAETENRTTRKVSTRKNLFTELMSADVKREEIDSTNKRSCKTGAIKKTTKWR